jgi:hypothetical protein
MRRERFIEKLNGLAGARTLVAIAAILVFFPLSANAAQPPSEPCSPASKGEYNSAKKQHLLRNRLGSMSGMVRYGGDSIGIVSNNSRWPLFPRRRRTFNDAFSFSIDYLRMKDRQRN